MEKWVKKGSNPRKTFYLKLAGSVIREVERVKDKDSMSYVRKEMISSGMALNLNGQEKVRTTALSASRDTEEAPREL